MNGFLLLDKPPGPTSHDVVDRVRRALGVRKVGHAGTLDPFASGLLIVGVGNATKQLQKFVGLDKEYEATFVLGAISETDDPEGPVKRTGADLSGLNDERVRAAMRAFIGNIEQVPPKYAAIKIGGKKMYEAARQGKPLVAGPRNVRVDAFEVLGPIRPIGPIVNARVRIRCSSGTYVRALARDLGQALGVGGYVSELRRTKIGPFEVKDATPLAEFSGPPAELAKRLRLWQDVLVTLDSYEKRQVDPSSL
jgi:tRNA pseudouridine55 synthase